MVSENQLAQDIIAEGVDVISLNEPYVFEGSVLGTPDGWTQMSSGGNRFRVSLWRITFSTILRHSDVVAIRCRWSGEWVLVITFYCALSEDFDLVLVPLTTLLGTYPNDKVFLVGDFNAKSMIWGNGQQIPEGDY